MKSEIRDLKKENLELRKEIKRLNKLVRLDFLTKVYNRHAFTNFIKEVFSEVAWTKTHKKRRKMPSHFSLLLIDIDNLKEINDKFGHSRGDTILKKTAKLLKESVREFDIVSRWGGDEFAILLREINISQSKKKAKILLNEVKKSLPITVSIGVIESNTKYSIAEMFKKADQALYQAKKKGKNQVIVV